MYTNWHRLTKKEMKAIPYPSNNIIPISPFNSLLYHFIMSNKLSQSLLKFEENKIVIRIRYSHELPDNWGTASQAIEFECEEVKLIDTYFIKRIVDLFLEALYKKTKFNCWILKDEAFNSIYELLNKLKIDLVQYNFKDKTSTIKNVTWDRQRESQFTDLVNKELQTFINIQKNKNMEKNQNLSIEQAVSTLDKLSEIANRENMKSHSKQMNEIIILAINTIGLLLGSSEVKTNTEAIQQKLPLNQEKEKTAKIENKKEEKPIINLQEGFAKTQKGKKEKKNEDFTEEKVEIVLFDNVQVLNTIKGQITNMLNLIPGKTDLSKDEKDIIKQIITSLVLDNKQAVNPTLLITDKFNLTVNKGNLDQVVKTCIEQAKKDMKEALLNKATENQEEPNKEDIVSKAEEAAVQGKEELEETEEELLVKADKAIETEKKIFSESKVNSEKPIDTSTLEEIQKKAEEPNTVKDSKDVVMLYDKESYHNRETLEEVVELLKGDHVDAFESKDKKEIEGEIILFNAYALKTLKGIRNADEKYLKPGTDENGPYNQNNRATVIRHDTFFNKIMGNNEKESNKAITNSELEIFVTKLLKSEEYNSIAVAV